jgi:3-hydroxyisobutyrate dehydrogenase
MKVAFIGLGTMGYPMAGHLCRAGFSLSVFNRTTEKAKKWSAEFWCHGE